MNREGIDKCFSVTFLSPIVGTCQGVEHRYICKLHGVVDFVLWTQNSHSTWVCPVCLRVKLEDKITDAKAEEPCYFCDVINNLKDCELCGKSVCPEHRVEDICNDCSEFCSGFRGY
jgi:hypothetical protein